MVRKAKRTLKNVHPDFSFKLISGGELHNLESLLTALKNMTMKTFYHHVTERKNDFSKWVKDVLKDEDLADAIECCHDQSDMERVVRNKIIELKDRIQMHEDFESFSSLLPQTKGRDDKDEKINADNDIKNVFDFRSLDDVKLRMHTIASGALFGLVIGLLLGYVFGKI